MSYKSDFDAFVGGTSGIFKGVKIEKDTCIQKNIQNLVSIADHDYVTTISWGDDEEKEVLIGCGTKSVRSVKIYDTECSSFTCSFFCNEGTGSINGISRYDDAVLTAVESGLVKLWRLKKKDQICIDAGENLKRMRHSRINKNIIATGGKENPLQLFDLETKQRIFVEKNLPHDSLELRVPIWISDIDFLSSAHKVATVGRYGHIRLYDTGAQRRPVTNIEIKDEAITTLAVTSREMQIIVGSGKGRMNLIDLRKPGKVLNTYKGSVGGVTGIACSKTKPYVVSVGLDRYIRVHHMDTKKLEKDIYLKSRLSCLLLRSDFTYSEKTENDCTDSRNNNVNNEEENKYLDDSKAEVDDAEYDALFDNMPVIGSKEDELSSHNNNNFAHEQAASVASKNVSKNFAKKRKKKTTGKIKKIKPNEKNEL